MKKAHQQLHDLRLLDDNWDEEGAHRPAVAAMERARSVLNWVERAGLREFEVDVSPDVVGGVAVWVWLDAEQGVWIACMNDRNDTAVFDTHDRVWAIPWTEEAKQSVLNFFGAKAVR